jgi:hypothetical protein
LLRESGTGWTNTHGRGSSVPSHRARGSDAVVESDRRCRRRARSNRESRRGRSKQRRRTHAKCHRAAACIHEARMSVHLPGRCCRFSLPPLMSLGQLSSPASPVPNSIAKRRPPFAAFSRAVHPVWPQYPDAHAAPEADRRSARPQRRGADHHDRSGRRTRLPAEADRQ